MKKVIIIGGGPAGISASLYTVRGNVETTIFTQGGSALIKAEKIENYYGFPDGVSGQELYQRGIESAKKLGAKVIEKEVIGVGYDGSFVVNTEDDIYKADALVIANGANRTTPRIKNIKSYEGRGVSYCAVCDAFFYRNKSVCVIGDGEYAVHEAKILEKVADNVVILSDGKKGPDYENVIDKKIASIEGDEVVERVIFEDGSSIETSRIFVDIGVAGGVSSL